ncbi:MAG: hypothetical protein ABI761_13785 [Saprospiraceae bacterium]
MNIKSFLTWVLVTFCSQFLFSQVKVNLTSRIELTFPQSPEAFDTLGQRVYNYQDEYGYYACIIRTQAVPPDKKVMDLKAFYSNIYKSLALPGEQCQLIKQTDLMLAGVMGAEFYATCKEDPEFPEIRYKRLILFENDLYVLDFWTTKAHLARAEEDKSKFLNSFVLHPDTDIAILPPAISTPNHAGNDRWIPWAIAGATIVLILGLIYFTKKQKKSLKKSSK